MRQPTASRRRSGADACFISAAGMLGGDMQVTETKAEGLARAYTGVATADEIAAKVDAKIEEVRPSAQLKGFRKGKAPKSLLKKMFGRSVLGEVMQEMVDGAVTGHFEETGHRPTRRPDVKITNENYQEGDDLTIEFSYELLPDVPDLAYKELSIERLAVSVEPAAVDAALAQLAEQASNYETKEGAAEEKDQVVIDFVGRIDGEAFEGGSGEAFPLTIGSGQFIPGFEEQLVGASAGDKRDVEVTFPEDYQAEALAGKAAVFETTVTEVRAPQAAAIDDELAKKFNVEDLATLKEQVTTRIGDEYKSATRSILKRRLLDALNEAVDFELPPTMLHEEAQQIAEQLWRDANPEADASESGAIEPTDEHTALARRRVKLGLLLADVGAKAEIAVSDAEIDQEIGRQAMRFGARAREYYDFASKNAQLRAQIRSPIFEDKVVDYIVERAEVSTKTVTEDELKDVLKAVEEEDAASTDATAA